MDNETVTNQVSPRSIAQSIRRPNRFRPDIEGLRAVAVVIVIVYHAGLSVTSGGYVGVDIFFVISGFLITGLLLTELERAGTISLTRFYARRARRLLPAAFVVLTAVAALSSQVLSPVRRVEVAGDVLASGLYVVNWRLAVQAVDYFGDAEGSPVQHFWSLAVEEQFYLVWPALLLAAGWWCRRRVWPLRQTLARVLCSVAGVSFAYCLYASYLGTDDAYFSSLTRAWELALGGLLALALASGWRLPATLAAPLAAAGLAGIAWATVRFDDATMFPGAAALLPTLGTAAVIAACTDGGGGIVARLLTTRVARHIGRISYSWYLWHWPVLIFAAARWGELAAWQALVVVAGSWVPAVVTYRLVEDPLRTSRLMSRPAWSLRLGAALTAATVATAAVLWVSAPRTPVADQGEVLGAEAALRGDAIQTSASAVLPDPHEAKADRSMVYDDGCLVAQEDTRSPSCVYGDRDSETTMVVYGDSLMMQYAVALDEIGQRQGWRLVVLTKSGCPPAEVLVHNANLRRAYTECEDWRADAKRRITAEKPDLILASGRSNYDVIQKGTRLDETQSAAAMQRGWEAAVQDLRTTGARVIVIDDIPHPDDDVPACVADALEDLTQCSFAKKDARAYRAVNALAADQFDDVDLVDPNPVLCRGGTCPAVIGDVIVYRDGNHLTATFVKTLTPWLEEQLPSPPWTSASAR